MIAVPEAPAWQQHAECAGMPTDWWFARGSTLANQRAKQLCRRCAVRADCLEWALEQGERFGIYGGLGPRERAVIVRGRATTKETP